ncbi:LysR family transcriptional regulator [Pseudomonas shahriarae]|uniref:LysR family transcriptional regulator n=1 Tax=Pseudomonas shahriarae TaxID=2745512 RepID=A0A9X4HFH5_9PSED|nr:LysR family transcriptional regulator [Pseudomonas shahriarae]MDD1011313.1 LysR family transcriptional regulator [Pseudomonas shahriarae]
MLIDAQILQKFDLNTLVTFLVVYQERGVSKAAKRLNVTQPAVSNVLGKLRWRFDDPLFIPCGRSVRPTSKADLIAQKLAPAMIILQGLITADTMHNAASAPPP